MECCQPIFITSPQTGERLRVPCGTCPACRDRTVLHWSFRLKQHLKTCDRADFLTLTYADENLRYVDVQPSLYRDEIPLFMKRLRKAHVDYCRKNKLEIPAISYFACGEYGSETLRPHYHMLLFNARLDLIQDAWGLGQIHYGQVTEASIAYTCKYICKVNLFGRDDDRIPEFRLMSKNLGLNFLSDSMLNFIADDYDRLMYVVDSGGKKLSMPRYYKRKFLARLAEEIGEEGAESYGHFIGYRALQRVKKVEAMERKKLGDEEFARLKYEQYALIYRKFFNRKKRKL